MSIRNKLMLLGGIAAIGLAALGAKGFDEISGYGVNRLIVCIESAPAPIDWSCGQMLEHKLKSVEFVADLNANAGALFAVLADDAELGRKLLTSFIEHGVDINATDRSSASGWSALHIMAMDSLQWPVEMLLESGADPSLVDANGMTALDLARKVQNETPEPGRLGIIQMLEGRQAP